jgi:demethylspheroidene O-methyltransferase
MVPTRWRDRWTAWRNGLLSDPRFQRWAADFPLTRPIAHLRTRDLFDLVAGFVYSQTLSACVELGLFDRLRAGPQTTAALAQALGLSPAAMERLLGAAKALGLVDELGPARYALGPQGAALLGNAGLIKMIEHHRDFYADLADSVRLLRQDSGDGRLAAYWPYGTSAAPDAVPPEAVSAYSELMTATVPSVAADVLHAYPMAAHRRVLDVGGGEGAFLTAVGESAPGPRLMLFDLPAVAQRARARLERAGLADRADVVAGDFLADPIPAGADLVTLVRILHDHGDQSVMTLLRSIRAALDDSGALLIAEPMSGAAGTSRVADVYFAFYLLAMGHGRARTPAEIIAMLRAAGFRRTRILPTRTPFLLSIIVAQP